MSPTSNAQPIEQTGDWDRKLGASRVALHIQLLDVRDKAQQGLRKEIVRDL